MICFGLAVHLNVEFDMAFYRSIKIDLIPKIATVPFLEQDTGTDIIIYDELRTSRVAATMLEHESDLNVSIIPYSSIRVIGGI